MDEELQNLQKLVSQIYDNFDQQKSLKRLKIEEYFIEDIHQQFWLGFLNNPFFIKYFEVQKPWTIYWNLNALASIKKLNLIPETVKVQLSKFLISFQMPEGGFSGSQNNQAHLLSSYAAVLGLAILGNEQQWKQINIEKMEQFLLSIKNENGSFNCNLYGEMDLRATYCALVISKLLNIQNKKIFENVSKFIKSCQSYEGGISPKPHDEAHGGFTFCGVASLSILEKLEDIDLHKLIYWLVNKQDEFYGGFKGRTNKLVDSCYSFWQASTFNILAEYNSKYRYKDDLLYVQSSMQKYLVFCCQDTEKGGFIDKPGKVVDFYHSNYAMMGLALSYSNKMNYLIGKTYNLRIQILFLQFQKFVNKKCNNIQKKKRIAYHKINYFYIFIVFVQVKQKNLNNMKKIFLFFCLLKILLQIENKVSKKLKQLFTENKYQVKKKIASELSKSRNKDINRKLMGMQDLVMPSDTMSDVKLMSAFIPQIGDPRIIIQTFNSPNQPILPGTLPAPRLKMHLTLPSKTTERQPDILIEDHVLDDKFAKKNEFLKQRLKEAFIESKVVRKNRVYNGKYLGNGIGYNYGPMAHKKLIIVNSLDEKINNQVQIRKRVLKIENRITELANNFLNFNQSVQKKLGYLEFLGDQWKNLKLNIIV